MPSAREVGYKQGSSAERLATPVGSLPLGTFWFESDTLTLYEVTYGSSSNVWEKIGGSGSTLPITQSFSGAGPYTVNADTDVVYLSPGGGTPTLTLPPLSLVDVGHEILFEQLTAGQITFVGSNTDPVLASTSSFILGAMGDAVRFVSTGASWQMSGLVGAPWNFTVWVSSAGSDTAVGTSVAPIATLDEAISRASRVSWRNVGTVNVMGATLTAPTFLTIPGGRGVGAAPLEILGTIETVSTGTVASSVAGTASTPMVVTATGTPWSANQNAGSVLRFTNGVLNGQTTGVFENTTSAATTYKFASGVPGNGDTFAIDRNVTSIASGFMMLREGTGFQIKFTRVNLNVTTLLAQNCFVEFDRVSSTTGAAFFEQNCGLQIGLDPFGWHLQSLAPGVSGAVLNVATINGGKIGMRSISMQVFRGSASLSSGLLISGLSRINVMSRATLGNLYCNGATVAGGTHLLDCVGGYMALTNATINNVSGGSAISVFSGQGRLELVTGTGNASPAVQARKVSGILVVNPNSGVTIASGGSDVKVGNNAATNWLGIFGATTAVCTDLGNPNSEICRIGA